MPIFEDDDEITPREFKRQQKATNRKAHAHRIERAKREEEEKIEKLAKGEFDLHLNNDWTDNDGGNSFDMAEV